MRQRNAGAGALWSPIEHAMRTPRRNHAFDTTMPAIMIAAPRALMARLMQGSPLRHPRFRLFYLGSIGSALGYTMQATIAAWLMATLTPSALMVALVQTASTAPSLLFGLGAGALADIVDRRRVLMVSQVMLFITTVVLAAATLAGVI